MELNDLVQMGTQLFKEKLGDQAESLDDNSVMDALSGLLSNEEGSFDMSNILSSLSDGNIGSIISSWIGSGENESIDGGTLASILGSDKISEFAEKLGIDSDTAAEGLSDVVPNMVDKATGDGSSILDSLGGVDGLMDMAKNFFGNK
ncbi:MAG: hypothetical protein DSZ05_08750 [Sulfurospirillum sp.]|nr:MAG: hypothetical protein DSZ05_08750 [Sulfurospirillum sp.]